MAKKTDSRLSEFEFAKFQDGDNPNGFDAHIANSIRDYDSLWENIVEASRYFVENGTNVYDLGASSGKLIKAIHEHNKSNAPNASYYGLDLEQNFVKDFTSKDPNVNMVCADIKQYSYGKTSFATSIFTLQFTPKEDRLTILSRLVNAMNDGAGFIIAEKTISEDSKVQDIMTSLYYQFKRKSFTAEEVLDKEQKLRSMMKPGTDEELQDLLNQAGFRTYQKIWQSYNFCAYLAIK